MGPLDFAPTALWVRFEKNIHELFKLNAAIFDPAGERVTKSLNWANPLCPAVKSTKKGQVLICGAAHQRVATEAVKNRAPVISACDAGMLKIVTPIYSGPSLVGVASGCGSLSERGEIDCELVSMLTELPQEEIIRLSRQVPLMSSEAVGAAVAFMMGQTAAMVHGSSV